MRFFPIPGGQCIVTVFALGLFASVLSSCVPESDLSTAIDGGAAFGEKGKSGELPEPGDWWKEFRDPGLNRLIEDLRAQNPGLKAALARYDQARAAIGVAKADQFPRFVGDSSAIRRRDSAGGIFVPPDITYNDYRAALNLEYEIDFWGRVRQSVNAAKAEFEASAADLAGAELSLSAELARTWFQLRFLNEEIRVLKQTLGLREENRKLVEARVKGGEANELDLERARTELEGTRALQLQLERSRAEMTHALSALVGEVPSQFKLPAEATRHGVGKAAVVPAGVPSELLARRPDIAAAERRLAAAASRVGVVRASYLPRITLGGVGGLSTLDSSHFFDPAAFFGEIGPRAQIPLWQGGQGKNDIAQSEAAAREALESYREIVIQAFREVEDALSGIRFLDREIGARQKASTAAEKAAELSRKRYEGGLVSYFEVVDAERTALAAHLELTRARSVRHLASVQLIQALGGGWGKAASDP